MGTREQELEASAYLILQYALNNVAPELRPDVEYGAAVVFMGPRLLLACKHLVQMFSPGKSTVERRILAEASEVIRFAEGVVVARKEEREHVLVVQDAEGRDMPCPAMK